MSRRWSAGFTLLEVTVSLSVTALALASLAHLVHGAAGLDASLSTRQRASGEAEALFVLLRELLDGPRREPSGQALRLAGGPGGPSVSGTADAVAVLSRGPRVLGVAEPTLFTLTFETGDAPDRGRILLGWSSGTSNPEQETVARARGFTLRYAATTGGELKWSETWSRPVADLAMIEVSLVEAGTARRVSQLIPVVSSLPRICVLHPLLEGCPQWH
ncbi:hypothetical protein [Methylorubrum extorquens]|uniref:hypothetical protein n=1 Tax=Methylorubrum extorquens TaxID=408 RepID=UPI0005C1AAC4|nr:hypothetical protein [Methylorubrum extorquens]MCP1545763.1 hypothetical protein [Methylorubrum extorquens]MCP1591714.1 hypothetical protein [Methylorubrum extorquens]